MYEKALCSVIKTYGSYLAGSKLLNEIIKH